MRCRRAFGTQRDIEHLARVYGFAIYDLWKRERNPVLVVMKTCQNIWKHEKKRCYWAFLNNQILWNLVHSLWTSFLRFVHFLKIFENINETPFWWFWKLTKISENTKRTSILSFFEYYQIIWKRDMNLVCALFKIFS